MQNSCNRNEPQHPCAMLQTDGLVVENEDGCTAIDYSKSEYNVDADPAFAEERGPVTTRGVLVLLRRSKTQEEIRQIQPNQTPAIHGKVKSLHFDAVQPPLQQLAAQCVVERHAVIASKMATTCDRH